MRKNNNDRERKGILNCRGFVHDRAQFDGHSVKFILSVDTDALYVKKEREPSRE